MKTTDPNPAKNDNDVSVALSQLLHEALCAKDPRAAARTLEACPLEQICETMATFPPRYVGALLLHFPAPLVQQVLNALPKPLVLEALLDHEPADAAALLRHLEPHARQEIIELVPQSIADTILAFLDLRPNAIGHGMITDGVPRVYEDQSVQEALEQLERQSPKWGNDVLVLDRDHHIVGIVTIADLLGADRTWPLSRLPLRTVPILHATDGPEAVGPAFEGGHATFFPVVDHRDRFMGIIPYERMLSPWRTKLLAPWLTMFGVNESESQETSLGAVAQRRLPWTSLILVNALVAAWMLSSIMPVTDTTKPFSLIPIVLFVPLAFGFQSWAATLRTLIISGPSPFLLRARCLNEVLYTAVQGLCLAVGLLMIVGLWTQSFTTAWRLTLSIWLTSMVSSLIGVALPWISSHYPAFPFFISSALFVFMTAVSGLFMYIACLGW